jgi:hypothetical protein
MDNRAYFESVAPNADAATTAKMVEVLDSYGDNRWWLSDDVRIIGYWQLNEPFLVVPFSKFHEGIEKLIGRPVWTHEFAMNLDGLKNEAANAILGVERTEAEVAEAIDAAMDRLFEYAKAHGKTILTLETKEERHGS